MAVASPECCRPSGGWIFVVMKLPVIDPDCTGSLDEPTEAAKHGSKWLATPGKSDWKKPPEIHAAVSRRCSGQWQMSNSEVDLWDSSHLLLHTCHFLLHECGGGTRTSSTSDYPGVQITQSLARISWFPDEILSPGQSSSLRGWIILVCVAGITVQPMNECWCR